MNKNDSFKYVYTLTDSSAENMAYGLAVYENGKIVEAINDVSFDKAALYSFVKVLNDEQLDPVQFEEAVEDFIAK